MICNSYGIDDIQCLALIFIYKIIIDYTLLRCYTNIKDYVKTLEGSMSKTQKTLLNIFYSAPFECYVFFV